MRKAARTGGLFASALTILWAHPISPAMTKDAAAFHFRRRRLTAARAR